MRICSSCFAALARSASDLTGRVIYRTKDDVTDWDGDPVFPSRQVNPPILFDAGPLYRRWLRAIHEFYSPYGVLDERDAGKRAAGWRCAQALQWAASSPHAGLGYLVRQAIRAGWTLQTRNLTAALAALRPYRNGALDEPVGDLLNRIRKDIGLQDESGELEDMEESDDRLSTEVDHARTRGAAQSRAVSSKRGRRLEVEPDSRSCAHASRR